MRDMDLGHFDYAVAMDSLIHYDVNDGVQTLAAMAARSNENGIYVCALDALAGDDARTGRFFPQAGPSAVH